MNSSISNSDGEPQAVGDASWRRWLVVFVTTLAGAALLLLAILITVDPYDSGRFGIFGIEGVSDINSSTANASHARDPQFDAAVIGDSTGQLLKPAELSRL